MKRPVTLLAVLFFGLLCSAQDPTDSIFAVMQSYHRLNDSVKAQLEHSIMWDEQSLGTNKTSFYKELMSFYSNNARPLLALSRDSSVLWFGKEDAADIKWLGVTTSLAGRLQKMSDVLPDTFLSGPTHLNLHTQSEEMIMNMFDGEDSVQNTGEELAFFRAKSFLADPLNLEINSRVIKPLSADIIVLKPSVYLKMRDYLQYVGDQGYIYSCSAWAAAGLKSIEDNIKRKRTFEYADKSSTEAFPSPSFIFTIAKENLGMPSCKAGVELLEAMKVLEDKGVIPLKDWPYYTNDIDCTIPEVNTDAIKLAATNRVKFAPVRHNVIDFQYCLSNNCPIAVEVDIDNEFIRQGLNGNWTKNNPYIWSKFASGNKERAKPHSMICIGYNDSYGAFLMVNSFGRGFGDNGMFWIEYDFMFDILQDAYHIKCNEFSGNSKKDKERIQLLNNKNVTAENESVFWLEEGANRPAVQKQSLKWKLLSLSMKNKKTLANLQVTKTDGTIIRKKIPLTLGVATYLTYNNMNYFIELRSLKEAVTGSALSIFNDPAMAELRITKIPVK